MSSTRGGTRLFTTYLIASLIPLLALGFLVDHVVRHEIDSRALAEAQNRAQTIANTSIEPVLGGTTLARGLSDAERSRLIPVTRSLLNTGNVVRLRLRDPAGDIVFDARNPHGATIPNRDDEVSEAAHGHPIRLLTRVNSDAVDGGSNQGQRAVETYLALRAHGNGPTIGVLELYLSYAPFSSAAHSTTTRLSWTVAGGLLLLWLILGLISWSVTQRLRRAHEDSQWAAHHDLLTGLPNRAAFISSLDRVRAHSATTVVAVADVVRFREVNDTLGYPTGDAFLRGVATALRDSLPDEVVLARLGGDSFGIATALKASHAADLATWIHDVPLEIEYQDVKITVELRIGLADDPRQDKSAVELLRAAELAHHTAREHNLPVVHYGIELEHSDPESLVLAAELRHAIGNHELVLHYQPKVDLVTGAVTSVEALIRWEHPRRGFLMPDEFIPIAESTSLIGPLTQWVITEAAQQLAAWESRGLILSVSINVSARNLRDTGLAQQVVDALQAHDIAMGRLEIEITETAAVADPPGAATLLRELRNAGVHASLDDFGQGATSLASLAVLPLSEIKIDRAFVQAIETNEAQQAIVRSVIELAHGLGLVVVAEGIETPKAAAVLTGMGCDIGQGFLFGRALDVERLEGWLLERYLDRPDAPAPPPRQPDSALDAPDRTGPPQASAEAPAPALYDPPEAQPELPHQLA